MRIIPGIFAMLFLLAAAACSDSDNIRTDNDPRLMGGWDLDTIIVTRNLNGVLQTSDTINTSILPAKGCFISAEHHMDDYGRQQFYSFDGQLLLLENDTIYYAVTLRENDTEMIWTSRRALIPSEDQEADEEIEVQLYHKRL